MIVVNHNMFTTDSTIILPNKTKIRVDSNPENMAELCTDLAYSLNDFTVAISTPNPIFQELASLITAREQKNYNTNKIKVTTI